MKGAQFIFILTSFLVCAEVYAQQAANDTAEVSQSETISTISAQCPAEQVLENRKIINECNASWTKWGIERPNDSELREENQCTGVFSSTTAMACGKALIAFPVFIAKTTATVINTVFPDKSSYDYISNYGTKSEITNYFRNKFINQQCGESYTVLKQQEEECKMMNEYGRMDSLEDSEREMWTTKCAEIQIKIQCHLNPPSPNRLQDEAMSRAIAKMVASVQARQTEEAEAQAKQNEVEKRIREIRMSCNKVDTSFSTLFNASMAASGSGMFQMPSTTETTNPEKFQDCVMAEIGDDQRLKNAFEEKSVSFLQPILNQVPAFKCYNEEVRRQFYCEMAMVALSGGTALAPAVARRLGTQVVVQAAKKMGVNLSEESVRKAAGATVSVLSGEAVENTMLRPVTSVLESGRSLVGRALSSNEVQVVQNAFDRGYDYVRNTFLNASQSVLEVEKLLGRKLTPRQQTALLRAKRIGVSRDLAFGGYTRDQLQEKDEILKAAGFTPEERTMLLQSGVTNSSGVAGTGETEDSSLTPANDNETPARIAASVEPGDLISPLSTPTGSILRSLQRIDDSYAGKPIQVKSLSGNTYEGELVEIVNVGGEMSMVLKMANGKTEALRVSKLDLSTVRENQNNFITVADGPGGSLGVSGMSLKQIEDLYLGQQIQVKSVSGGNVYSGEFVKFMNTNQGMMMVFKDKNGLQDAILASRLDLSSWRGAPREFTIARNGKLTPTPGTALGTQMASFKTRTGLDLEIRQSPKVMKEDFLINYETGLVTLNPNLRSNPERLEALLKTEIPRRISIDRQVRTNLASQHGLRLSPSGIIEVVNPTSTVGRMVAGMKKNYRTVITAGEEGLGTSRGVSFTGTNRISLNPELLLPGRESELVEVLRHEIKHNTTDRRSSKYSLLSGDVPNVTALRYAGRNISIVPGNRNGSLGLEQSGVHSGYSRSGFRADEFEARLTQYTPDSGDRGGAYDDSRYFAETQAGWMNEVIQQNLSPQSVSFRGGITTVSYKINYHGSEMFISVPIKGSVLTNWEAEKIAELVIMQRVRDLTSRANP